MKWQMTAVAVVVVGGVLALLGLGARDGRGRTTGAVEIGRPASVVFPLLVQPPLRKQWLLAVQEISPVGDPTLRSGARSRVVLDAPEQMEVDEEIRVVETDRRLLLQRTSSHPPFSQRLEYVLKDLGGGRSLVTVAIHTTYHGALFNLLEPLLTRAAQSRLDQELAQLRTASESTTAGAPTASALPVVTTPTVPAPPSPEAPAEPAIVPASAPEAPPPAPEVAPPGPPPGPAAPTSEPAAPPPTPETPEEPAPDMGQPAPGSPEILGPPAEAPPESDPAMTP